ncbi:MAG: hypothetical protein V4686_03105 [Patescibacteria group bacterium]
MKTKTRVLLTLLLSFLLSAFSAAKQTEGVIIPDGVNTIASAIELKNGNIVTICPKFVHPAGIKKLTTISYAFRGKATRKGFILSELWPVKTVAEMNVRIAQRDGTAVSETPIVIAKATPIPAEAPVAPVAETRSFAGNNGASATLVESNPPPAIEPPTVQTVDEVKIVTPAPSKGVPYAVMSEADALLPSKDSQIKGEPLIDNTPPPTLEEVEAADNIPAPVVQPQPPVLTEEPAPVVVASAPAPVVVTPPAPIQLPVPTFAPKLDPTQMSVIDRADKGVGEFATVTPVVAVVEKESSNTIIYVCGALLVLGLLFITRKMMSSKKRITSLPVIKVAPTTIARRPDPDPDKDPTPTSPGPSGRPYLSSALPSGDGKHVSIKEVVAQQKAADKSGIATRAQRHSVTATTIGDLVAELTAQGHNIPPAVLEQDTEETSVASATAEPVVIPQVATEVATKSNVILTFRPAEVVPSSIPSPMTPEAKAESVEERKLEVVAPQSQATPHSPFAVGTNLPPKTTPSDENSEGKKFKQTGNMGDASRRAGKKIRRGDWDNSKTRTASR